ncbi:hypothetical protein LTS10_005539 [Elasticomyces elasticus]|nr:hypothetical protein LTS10_005539 [Elasticomyces elasticus]
MSRTVLKASPVYTQDPKCMTYWCNKLGIQAKDTKTQRNCLVNYICDTLLEPLAPYYLVKNALGDVRHSPRETHIFARLDDPEHQHKFDQAPTDWSEYERLDICCYAVTVIIRIMRNTRLTTGQGHRSGALLPKWPQWTGLKEEVLMACRFLTMINLHLQGTGILSPKAKPSTRFDKAQRQWQGFHDKEDFAPHMHRIVTEAQQKVVLPRKSTNSATDAELDDDNDHKTEDGGTDGRPALKRKAQESELRELPHHKRRSSLPTSHSLPTPELTESAADHNELPVEPSIAATSPLVKAEEETELGSEQLAVEQQNDTTCERLSELRKGNSRLEIEVEEALRQESEVDLRAELARKAELEKTLAEVKKRTAIKNGLKKEMIEID